MNLNQVEILLVEDNPDDVELALHALRKENLANSIHVARDGEEALEFLFCQGPHAERSFEQPPKLVLLDLKLPKVDSSSSGRRSRQLVSIGWSSIRFPRRTGWHTQPPPTNDLRRGAEASVPPTKLSGMRQGLAHVESAREEPKSSQIHGIY